LSHRNSAKGILQTRDIVKKKKKKRNKIKTSINNQISKKIARKTEKTPQ